jgi:hypothetical protein
MPSLTPTSLIAPCGMNCSVCIAFLREKNKCQGCRSPDMGKSVSILRCRIKNCESIKSGPIKFCFSCDCFPCKRLKDLDKRYRTKYHMSMIENLGNIKRHGIRAFVKKEKKRWECAVCAGTVCVHRGYCFKCGKRAW